MTDGFEATFRVRMTPEEAWARLTAGRDEGRLDDHLWLPGFDARATVVEADPPHRLQATKDDEPCAGTDIAVTLEEDGTGTRIRIVQSRFGAWLDARYEMMSIGWKYIVADLQAVLATGVHARRHFLPWGDLGAAVSARDGGVHVGRVREGALAARLGMADGDLLVALAGAPVASCDDLVTVLRVLASGERPVTAEWIREGSLMTATLNVAAS